MLSRGRLTFIFTSLATVLLLVSGTILAATAAREDDDGEDSMYKYLSVFTEVLGLVQRAYVDEAATAHLMDGALEGVVDALDQFSLYIPAAEMGRFEEVQRVGVTRSGLLVLKERGVAYAATVEEGSPAAQAGIERGDVVSMVAGRSTRDTPLFTVHAILAGEPGTKVEVELLHLGVKETVTLELADYARPGVEVEVKSGVPVLRIAAFHAETPANLKASLATLESEEALPGLETADRLVIDLRGVAGGDAKVAYAVAGLFASGELGVLSDRDEVVEVFASNDSPRWRGRVAVLIDRGTQGPAEILATTLRQTIGASLVGASASFGYSGRQSLVSLSNGDRLLLTDAFYTGPDRAPIREVLEPDVRVRLQLALTEEEQKKAPDEVLEKAIEVVRSDEVVEEKAAA